MKSDQKAQWGVGVTTAISVACAVVCAGFVADCLVEAANFHDRHVDGHLHLLWVRVTDAQTGVRLRPMVWPRERFTSTGLDPVGSGHNLPLGDHWAADVEQVFMVWRPVRATQLVVYVPGYCAKEVTAGMVEEEEFTFSLTKCAGEVCTNDACRYMRTFTEWLNKPAGQLRVLDAEPAAREP